MPDTLLKTHHLEIFEFRASLQYYFPLNTVVSISSLSQREKWQWLQRRWRNGLRWCPGFLHKPSEFPGLGVASAGGGEGQVSQLLQVTGALAGDGGRGASK